MSPTDRYIKLVEMANSATSEPEHLRAESVCAGFMDAVRCLLGASAAGSILIAADLHYIDQGIERPMCGGQFLDWKPSGVTP